MADFVPPYTVAPGADSYRQGHHHQAPPDPQS
jgi:hypothetical protein